ncbi:unnamed protein product [Parascedosporium putredinis]|uniref:FAD-binding PCMH-type domain-containing protein n=1 Tax=Parascedosporium putredinis TaxID=1442378 RepID=A0A9P1M7G7_9PEZI|nr:unnamed protein product [Parascedosporium putredinis]CAI7988166.1 unnamed protein product [Parascedosporium putredinis]
MTPVPLNTKRCGSLSLITQFLSFSVAVHGGGPVHRDHAKSSLEMLTGHRRPPGPVSMNRLEEDCFNQLHQELSVIRDTEPTTQTNAQLSSADGRLTSSTQSTPPPYPCDASGYPAFVVNATNNEHVQAAVNFARDNNVRLIIKGTGHDFMGRSIAPNSLSIWTHHMKGIEYHEGSFTPQGCDAIETNAVTTRAGGQMFDLQSFLRTKNETVVGGNSRSVGVGGYLSGGGHSILGSQYGLGSDHILEVELVTPDGEVVVANECQNEDLFWAVRGGGGSTFGQHLLPWPPDFLSGVMGLVTLPGATNETEIYAAVYPAIQEAQAKFPDTNVTVVAVPEVFDCYQSWWDKYFDNGTAGTDSYLSSRLFNKDTLADVDSVAAALEEYLASSGTALAHLLRRASGMEDAYVHVVKGQEFDPLDQEAKNAAIERIRSNTEILDRLAPNSGAYLNEASLFEDDWQHTFWGDNYERLLEIKRKVDPKSVFVCHPCVGSEGWEETNGRLCKA